MDNIQITQECLKAITGLGKTSYQNVCNGNFHTVPWGLGEWFGAVAIVGFCLLFTWIFIKLIRDDF